MPLPTGCVLLRLVVGCALLVRADKEHCRDVLLRTVESGEWRVERDRAFASLRREK